MAETIQTKQCSKCKQIKSLFDFNKASKEKDGHQGYCKICKTKQQTLYRQTTKGKTTQKRYENSEKGKIARKRCFQRHFLKYPEKRKARLAVNNAITLGKLPRPDTLLCHFCPKPAQQYHHWQDYAPEHWLDVMPVCIKCHRKIA